MCTKWWIYPAWLSPSYPPLTSPTLSPYTSLCKTQIKIQLTFLETSITGLQTPPSLSKCTHLPVPEMSTIFIFIILNVLASFHCKSCNVWWAKWKGRTFSCFGKDIQCGRKKFLRRSCTLSKKKNTVHAWNGMNRREKMTLRQGCREYFDGGHKSWRCFSAMLVTEKHLDEEGIRERSLYYKPWQEMRVFTCWREYSEFLCPVHTENHDCHPHIMAAPGRYTQAPN